MTREEAIRILDPDTTKEELAGIKGYAAMMKVVDEACILAVAALREQEERRWIPVTERLPESGGTYLVYTERGSVYATHFYEKKVFRDDYVREPQWSQRGKVKVTHWMPMPKTPKEA